MEWAGDFGNFKKQAVCSNDKSISPIGERKNRVNCSSHRMRNEYYKEYSMLISKNISIQESPALYSLIYSDELSKTYDGFSKIEYNIILCSEDDIYNPIIYVDPFKTIRFQHFDLYKCKDGILYTTNIIAIIAPGPEYVEELVSYDKPIIFYAAVNNYEIIDMYNNAIMRKTKLQDEVNTLWNLISLRWNRVAILSDGSVENGAFEKEVRTLFERKEVSYTVRSLEGQSKCCDFNEVSNLNLCGMFSNFHNKAN